MGAGQSRQGLGGWLAATFAVSHAYRLRTLTLLDAAGLWLDEAPMADLFLLPQEELTKLMWHDPSKAPAPPPPTPESSLAQAKASTRPCPGRGRAHAGSNAQ